MKKSKKLKLKTPSLEEKRESYPHRLIELESELRTWPARPATERLLSTVEEPKAAHVGSTKVVQFLFGDKTYCTGFMDSTYAASNHARGVRHIYFYEHKNLVLHIEGDFENQEFGSNFKFHSLKAFTPGDWEKDFVKLTDELSHHKEKRRQAFRKKRASLKH